MGILNKILSSARARGVEGNLPYSGAILPSEAAQLLQLGVEIHIPVKLVDVRSQAEWQFVGTIPHAIAIELKTFPGMQNNPHFLVQLKHQVDHEAIVLFLCRTGARSDAAARIAAENGFANCYNILYGFEGDKDSKGQRGKINGWKAAQLTWSQS